MSELFKMPDEKDIERKLNLPKLMPYDDFMAMEWPVPVWIAGELVAMPALIAVSGKRESYKTFFTFWLAYRIASGQGALFGNDKLGAVSERVGVLLLNEENMPGIIKDRFELFIKGPDSPSLYFYAMHGFKMTDDLWRQEIIEQMKTAKIKVLVMDPFISCMGFKNENDNSEVASVMDILRRDFLENGITVIFLHHPPKSDEHGTILRGASDIIGKCDIHFSMSVINYETPEIAVRYEKMRIADHARMKNFRISLDGKRDEEQRIIKGTAFFAYLGEISADIPEKALDKVTEQILDFMRGNGHFRRATVAEALGRETNDGTFKRAWFNLQKDGRIRMSPESKKFEAVEVERPAETDLSTEEDDD